MLLPPLGLCAPWSLGADLENEKWISEFVSDFHSPIVTGGFSLPSMSCKFAQRLRWPLSMPHACPAIPHLQDWLSGVMVDIEKNIAVQ
jgi:hypothetical protein